MKPNQFVFGGIAGHGGIVDGVYTTAPSKMFTFPDGKLIYEGVENREMIRAIETVNTLSYSNQVNLVNLIPHKTDVPLSARERIVKQARDKYKAQGLTLITLESHLNADDGSGKASGCEGYTTVGDDFSDVFAEAILRRVKGKGMKLRADERDGDLDKEKDFYLIRKSKALGVPSVLMEWFFMTNRQEVDKYANFNQYLEWAHLVIEAMIELDEKYKGVIV